MFRRFQTRLTVLYAALFGVVLIALWVAVRLAVDDQAGRVGERGLAAAGEVFERLWEVRAQRLQGGATLLARDYGFRAALATHDAPTADSAVDNLRGRLGLDLAFVVGPDGALVAASDRQGPEAARAAYPALADGGEARGVMVVDGAAYEAVSAPIMAPDLKGWIVFAVRLDARQMDALTRLSSIPLRAQVVRRGARGWTAVEAGAPSPARLTRTIDADVAAAGDARANRRARVAPTAAGPSLVLARSLPAVGGDASVALLLEYPMREARAPFRGLLLVVGAVGLAGLGLVVVGGGVLARSVTRPLSLLTEAARALSRGDAARVEVTSRDEVGDLAQDFNAMAEAVAERERRLTVAALTDPETDLPNRPALDREVERLAAEGGGCVFVAAFGVERYARMRGAIGHQLAADLMRALGEGLRAEQPDAFVARTSADMLNLAFRAPDAAAAMERVRTARETLEKAQSVGDQLIDVRVTAGLSAGSDPSELVREADLALDTARAAGARRGVFDPSARARAAESLQLMPALRRAVLADGLSLAHQPKYDVRSGRIVGVESLVRWTHPRLGPLAPDSFIGPAEETGDIRALTEWVVARAVAEQAELAAVGHALTFSINLSGRLVGDPAITEQLLGLLDGARAPVCLEITETAVMGRPEAALAAFSRFQAAGVAISIDDYGAGLSSLAYLRRIAASELKLDRSIVCDVTRSARDALLVRSTVDLAHGLGMKVVAEGVEDEPTMALLAGIGCDLIQGWHVAKAMPLGSLVDYLAARTDVPAVPRNTDLLRVV